MQWARSIGVTDGLNLSGGRNRLRQGSARPSLESFFDYPSTLLWSSSPWCGRDATGDWRFVSSNCPCRAFRSHTHAKSSLSTLRACVPILACLGSSATRESCIISRLSTLFPDCVVVLLPHISPGSLYLCHRWGSPFLILNFPIPSRCEPCAPKALFTHLIDCGGLVCR